MLLRGSLHGLVNGGISYSNGCGSGGGCGGLYYEGDYGDGLYGDGSGCGHGGGIGYHGSIESHKDTEYVIEG